MRVLARINPNNITITLAMMNGFSDTMLSTETAAGATGTDITTG